MSDLHVPYNLALVALSFGIAAIASLTSLDLAGRVRAATGLAGQAWLGGGAFAMGTGIWAMHFIGMLAMDMTANAAYGIPLTLLSLVAAVLSSALALAIVQTGRLTRRRLGFGALIMGLGVCLMHYVGMEALQTRGALHYRPGFFLVSLGVAVSAAALALWLAFRLNPSNARLRVPLWQRGLAALVMAVGISGMHYLGMAAVIYPDGGIQPASGGLSNGQLAITVALVSTCIMLAALLIALFDAHLSSRNAQLAASLREANRELKEMVYRDALTQLPNRLLLEERLDNLLDASPRSFAVFFVDLDRFKHVNDSLGHHVGDELIRQSAARLQAAVRDTDTVARVGGDEFMVLMDGSVTRDDAGTLARRLVSTLDQPFQIDSGVVKVSTSVGIGLYPEHGRDKHALMVHADAAMYGAKQRGRNTFQFFEPDMTLREERRIQLERRLRLAVENESLSLAYQPKVQVETGRITGVEALLRWHDEELGRVTPDEMIPLAEDSGLILPIGEWVLRTACRYAKAWEQDAGHPLAMAVNISAVQLNERHFVDTLRKVLAETGLPPYCLELELTESALIRDPDHALKVLNELRALGVTLSIDDFGTGYSNLAQLRRFPIDRLKIDRTFMSQAVDNRQDAAIVKAVVALARSLDLQVVAEGIENEDQLRLIHQLQSHEYQGYLCSKALPGDELRRFLSQQSRALTAAESGRLGATPAP
ncbi:putative bifunctional diguanylate cyclase/phosphodiesterase [Halomonas getboli]|uniref:putative bifunctional diguanylate cyclase/phosphodiesterase n=1 Tax=Halomonas getboli TaxID=2935862 RepID=UPI001FFE7A2C|nr:bifunctional diguanylate cyclase/phosphodiesterase [Halomonas getboli]MCK2184949.1 EAL domain-containing protein [Halomonas getboli]